VLLVIGYSMGIKMNDFTKDELEILHSAIDYWITHIALDGSKISPVILKKIQSLIDNYCGHEDYRKDEWMICVCNKCHKAFDNDSH
jgi:hypothetical protein